MKHRIYRLTAATTSMVILGTILSACGKSSTAELVDDTYERQELSIYLWAEHIPDSVISDFEAAYGVTANVSTYTSNEEMLAKLESSPDGTYDIVQPSDYMVAYMVENEMLAPLDYDILTNFENLDPAFLDQYFDPGNVYSIPFAPGEIIPCYDKSVIPEGTITSLDDLFASEYAGKIVVLDDMRIVIGMTAMSMGYSLSESDMKKLDAVDEKLQAFKPNVYAMRFEASQELLLSGEVPVGYIFNGNVATAMLENENIVPVWPEEGSYIWIDNFCILNSSEKQELANVFINYILEAEVDKKCREAYPSNDPNTAGWALVDEAYRNCEALNIPAEQMEKGEYAMDVSEDVMQRYTEMWTAFTQ